MNKELKELILILKNAGFNDEVSRLIKYAEDLSVDGYKAHFLDNNLQTIASIVRQSRVRIEDNIDKAGEDGKSFVDDYLLKEKKVLTEFAEELAQYISDTYDDEKWKFLIKFDVNNGKLPPIGYKNESFNNSKFLGKSHTYKDESYKLYRGYKSAKGAKERGDLEFRIGFTRYQFATGEGYYGKWMSCIGRKKSATGVDAFMERNINSTIAKFKKWKESKKTSGSRTTETATETDTASIETVTTDTSQASPFVRVSIPKYRKDCGATAKIGSYCKNNGNSAIEKMQKMINLLSSADQIKEDGYFGNISAEALHQMGVDYKQPVNKIYSALSSIKQSNGVGSYPLSLSKKTSRRTGTGRGASRKKVKDVSSSLPDESSVIGMW